MYIYNIYNYMSSMERKKGLNCADIETIIINRITLTCHLLYELKYPHKINRVMLFYV